MSLRKILIVDDIEENREILEEEVLCLGYKPICADNGQSGLSQVEKESPDLILLDMLMPVMNGIQMLKHLKSDVKMKHIPVVMISALDNLDQIAQCIKIGADDYLGKPYNEVLLQARITSCLEKKKLYDEEKRQREELEMGKDLINRKNKDLDAANRKLKKLLQICSHELRNPLGQILLGSEHLIATCEPGKPLEEENREFLNIIHHSCLSMESILSDTLGYLKAQNNQNQENHNGLDINHLINLVIDNMKPSIQKKKAHIQLSLASDLPYANGNQDKILQALDNYINNAIKYSPPNSKVVIRTKWHGDKVRLEVEDEGPGISENERHLLFKTFAKLSNNPTGDEKKVGLGLSIVKRLIKDQGGAVGAYFPQNKGSVFWFQLPRSKKKDTTHQD